MAVPEYDRVGSKSFLQFFLQAPPETVHAGVAVDEHIIGVLDTDGENEQVGGAGSEDALDFFERKSAPVK